MKFVWSGGARRPAWARRWHLKSGTKLLLRRPKCLARPLGAPARGCPLLSAPPVPASVIVSGGGGGARGPAAGCIFSDELIVAQIVGPASARDPRLS